MSGCVGEGMPVRVRALGVSDRGVQGETARGAVQAQGGLMFSTPLQNMLAQGDSCPEFNGTCEGWYAWIRRWLDFKRTFCSMGVESDQVVAKVLMMKVNLATRTKEEMSGAVRAGPSF